MCISTHPIKPSNKNNNGKSSYDYSNDDGRELHYILHVKFTFLTFGHVAIVFDSSSYQQSL
jgi:hypothetical protein